jgi:diadenosine tetraphosphate (Ap4A) HIT family hydrolase
MAQVQRKGDKNMELWEPFAEKFEADKLTVFSTDHWTVLVRTGQVTLGTLVLAANRNFISASEMTHEELLEFPAVVGRMEKALAQAFQYDKINYLCLMMTDRHYHFHVIPRYEQPRQFLGVEWTDSPRPGVPNLAVPRTDDSTLIALTDHLRQY